MAKAVEPATVLVVLDSFVGEVGGEEIYFRRGELIERSHPAVKKWPSLFGPVAFVHPVKPEPRIEQATAAPGEKRGA